MRQHFSVFPLSMTNTHVFSEIQQSVQQENIFLVSRENIVLFSIENIFLFSSFNQGILRHTPIRLIGKHFNVFHRKHFSVFSLENIYLFSSKNPSILRYQEPSWKTFLCFPEKTFFCFLYFKHTPIRLTGKHFNVFHRKHFSVFQLENIYLFSS